MTKDPEKEFSSPPETLPDYLGLGILDPDSVVMSPDKISADYRHEHEVIYRVSIGDQNCQIMELLDGVVIATTSGYKTLRETFFHHLGSQPPQQSKRLVRLFHEIANNRNIYVRYHSQPPYLYYPAGYLVCLRQPIVSSNKPIFDRLAEQLINVPDKTDLKLDSNREGVILRLQKIGEVTVEQIMLADFSSTLLHLVSSVDFLWKSGVVPAEREYRLTVMDVSEGSAGNISIYLGEPSHGFATFSPIVTEGADLDLEKAKTLFRESSFRLLEGLKRDHFKIAKNQ